MRRVSLLFSIILIALTIGCEKDQTDLPIEEIAELEQQQLKTVPLEFSQEYFKNLNNSPTGKNGFTLDIDLASIEQLDIETTNEKINVADAFTGLDGVESKIFQVETNGIIETFVRHLVPDKAGKAVPTMEDGNLAMCKGCMASGKMYVTTTGGLVKSTARISNNTINIMYIGYDGWDPDPIVLDEVIVTAPALGSCFACPSSGQDWAWLMHPQNISIMQGFLAREQAFNLFEDSITTGLRGEKERCVYQVLTTGSGRHMIPLILSSFEGFDADIELIIKSATNLPSNVGGETTWDKANNRITITVNSVAAQTQSMLTTSNVLTHEIIHAAMFGALNKKNIYIPSAASFEETYNKYNTEVFLKRTSSQHNTMAELYVDMMANVMDAVHKNGWTDNYAIALGNYGAETLKTMYKGTAFTGLEDTQAWTNLTQDQRDEYEFFKQTLENIAPYTCP